MRRGPGKPWGFRRERGTRKKAATVGLDRGLPVDAQARQPGGVLGEGPGVDYHDPAVAALYDPVALELAHHLGDGLPGGGDHVGEVLVGEAHVYQRAHTVALSKALAEVHEQRREPGRDFPVQQALYQLIGLPEPLGERGEELEGEAGVALYHPLYGCLLDARDM